MAIRRSTAVFAALLLAISPLAAAETGREPSLADAILQVQPKMVKIYGAGGLRGLEAYQSGFLISEEGHILTAWSYVLDTDAIGVTLSDGRKFEAKLVGADPRLEIAVLKIEASGLPCFDLSKAARAELGTRVLAFSNLFGVAMGNEHASVQHGSIAAIVNLTARRGAFETPYDGPAYVLDVVTSNPGVAGGALVTRQGELLGILGKEMQNALNNTWLSYAIPIDQLRESVDQIRAGKFVARQEKEAAKKPQRAASLRSLGLVMVPDVVPRTPAFIDQVLPASPAAKAGLQPDDLIVLVGDRLTQSCAALRDELSYIDHEDAVKLTVLRAQEMREFVLQPAADSQPKVPVKP